MPTETTPATSTSGSTTPLCGHCGRPVINTPAVVYGGVAYHTECTRSPYAADEIERLRAERDGCSIMPDIVERLRALSRHEHDDLSVGNEAADEIERLRAELEKADEAMRTIIRQAMTIEQAENVAIDFLWWRQKSASPVPQNGEI